MKKFKKGVLAIGVLAAAAVIAAGCGKKDAKTTNETKKESAAESAQLPQMYSPAFQESALHVAQKALYMVM